MKNLREFGYNEGENPSIYQVMVDGMDAVINGAMGNFRANTQKEVDNLQDIELTILELTGI